MAERINRRVLLAGALGGFGFLAGLGARSLFREEKSRSFNDFPYLPGDQKIARLLHFIDRTDNINLKIEGQRLREFIEDETFHFGSQAYGGFLGNPFEVEFFGNFPNLNHSRWRIGLVDATRVKSAAELSVYFFQAMKVLEDGMGYKGPDLAKFHNRRFQHEASAWETALEFAYEPQRNNIKSRPLENLYQRHREAEGSPDFNKQWYKALRQLQKDIGAAVIK